MLNKINQYQITLASKSPRRQQLLKDMGIHFDVQTKDTDETYPPHLQGKDIAVYLAELKAAAFEQEKLNKNQILITADTIVWHQNQVLSKPTNKNHAFEILSKLSGGKHEVITGICLRSNEKQSVSFASTSVYFKDLSEEEINYYIDNYKPYDKAGAYGIQEWIGYVAIEKIEGSYFNVVGLPTKLLFDELTKFL